jgi:hypothetical protein
VAAKKKEPEAKHAPTVAAAAFGVEHDPCKGDVAAARLECGGFVRKMY